MPQTTRPYIARETRLLSEFLAKEFPADKILLNVRLGAIHPELSPNGLTPEELRMLGVFRRFADAIVIKPDRLILIEAAIKPSPGDLSMLELYELLIAVTPELEPYRTRKVQKMLVWAIRDEFLGNLARQHGIIVREYHPLWVDEYLRLLSPRQRRAARAGILVTT